MACSGPPGPTGVRADKAAEMLLALLAGLPATTAGPLPLLAALTDAVGRLPEVGAAGTMWRHGGERLRHVAATDSRMRKLQELQELGEDGPSAESARSNAIVHVEDLTERGQRWPAVARAAREAGLATLLALPLAGDAVGSDTANGVLNVAIRAGREWSASHAVVLTGLADLVSARAKHHEEWERLQRTTAQLQHALEARVIVEQAKGIVAERRGVTVEQALALMRRNARGRGRTLKAVAADVVAGRLQL